MNAPLLEVRGLVKSFGRAAIIRGAELQVKDGERHALIGPNGAGKSTLFHLISGRIAADSGSIVFGGQEISGLPAHQIARRGLARSFQINNLFANLSAFENIRMATLWSQGLHLGSLWRLASRVRSINERASQVLEQLHLSHARDLLVGTLSYAEHRARCDGYADERGHAGGDAPGRAPLAATSRNRGLPALRGEGAACAPMGARRAMAKWSRCRPMLSARISRSAYPAPQVTLEHAASP